jgi:hypothetical protein
MTVSPPLSPAPFFGTIEDASRVPGSNIVLPIGAYNAPSPGSAGSSASSSQPRHLESVRSLDESHVLATLATLCNASEPASDDELDDAVRLALCITLVGHDGLSARRGMQIHFRNSDGSEDSLDFEAIEADTSDPIVICRGDGRMPTPADLCNALGGERVVAGKLRADVAVAVPAMTAELSRTALTRWIDMSPAWTSARTGHAEPRAQI